MVRTGSGFRVGLSFMVWVPLIAKGGFLIVGVTRLFLEPYTLYVEYARTGDEVSGIPD